MNQIERALKRPFKESEVLWRKGAGGKELCYVTATTVRDRLDSAVGPENWQVSYASFGDRTICTISIRINGEWISKSDGAGDTNIEGKKGGLSDSFKRAGAVWGIGRYLYNPDSYPQGSNGPPAYWATQKGFDEIWAERDAQETEKFRAELGSASLTVPKKLGKVA